MGAPAILDAYSQSAIERLNDMGHWLHGHVVGGIVSDGGTTQATGASGVLNFDFDATAVIDATVNGTPGSSKAATTDGDATAGDGVVWGATSGKSVIFAVVYSTGSGGATPAFEGVPGAVAASGSEVAPTDAEITTALGHSNWVRKANVTVVRTADTTVTFTANHKVDSRMTGWAATQDIPETESAARAG